VEAKQVLDEAVALTRNNTPLVFNLAFNYGGRAEIVRMARKLLAEQALPAAISESTVNEHLWTAGLPDVDLVIRTGGDQRMSNFLPRQSAYACIYIVDAYWPAVTRNDIEEGIKYCNQTIRQAA
jgi:undecaprenyl diphosphate synthase